MGDDAGEPVEHAPPEPRAAPLPPADVAAVEAVIRKACRRQRVITWATTAAVVATAGAYVAALVGLVAAPRWPWMYWVISGLSALATYWFGTRHVRSVAAQLDRIEDPRLVGTLVDALRFEKADVSEAVHLALVRLLPRMTARDAAFLDEGQRAALVGLLEGSTDESASVKVAVLRALPQIGREKDVPEVERLAALPPASPPAPSRRWRRRRVDPRVRRANRRLSTLQQALDVARLGLNPRVEDIARAQRARDQAAAELADLERIVADGEPDVVQRAAQECLAALRPRLEAERTARSLLRPAEAPAAQMLLRPAQPAAEADPATLLRPATEAGPEAQQEVRQTTGG